MVSAVVLRGLGGNRPCQRGRRVPDGWDGGGIEEHSGWSTLKLLKVLGNQVFLDAAYFIGCCDLAGNLACNIFRV